MSNTTLFTLAPHGFRYETEIMQPDEEQELVSHIRDLPLAKFEFRGFRAKRRVVSYGSQCDLAGYGLRHERDIPSSLLPLRSRAAAFGPR